MLSWGLLYMQRAVLHHTQSVVLYDVASLFKSDRLSCSCLGVVTEAPCRTVTILLILYPVYTRQSDVISISDDVNVFLSSYSCELGERKSKKWIEIKTLYSQGKQQ